MSDIVIGIDLGTTNSCVCMYLENRLRLLENTEGEWVTPSFVYFHGYRIIVGNHAKRMAANNPENGIYGVKRLIGRQYNDVQKNLTSLPFTVRKSASNEAEIILTCNNQVIKKTPQEICTLILKILKRDAEAKLGHPVDKAVITVPAYFNTTQREATLTASRNAGFNVLKLLDEPAAAVLSYYYETESLPVEKSFLLVYNLTHTTCDVAVLSCKGTDIKVIGVDGDTHLGGHDFDNLLIEHVCQFFISKYNCNPKESVRSWRCLKRECVEAKETLSTIDETAIMPFENDTFVNITRVQFENLCKDLFRQAIDIVDRCLQKSNLTSRDIKEVILSGGSTRIPKIQNMIRAYFGGKELYELRNPDECVAKGAALQAAMLSTDKSQTIKVFQN